MEKDKSECDEKYMITNEITIRNGKIISSACEKCSDDSDAINQCESNVSCDKTWTRFQRSIRKNDIQKASINAVFVNFYDPFINGLIGEQCSDTASMDVQLRSNKKDVRSSSFTFQKDNQEIKCIDAYNDGKPCPEFEVRFCCERKDHDLEWISSPKEYDELGGIILNR